MLRLAATRLLARRAALYMRCSDSQVHLQTRRRTLCTSGQQRKSTTNSSKPSAETSTAGSKPYENTIPQGPMTWKVLALTAAIGTGGLVYYSSERERRMKEISGSKTVGRAAIGGEFSVVDGKGTEFTDADLKGHWSLLYFGFTMCPDICPAELTKVAEALDMLEKRGRKIGRDGLEEILPIFVSIDPERDSPARSDEYASEFHPGFIGLSGDTENVRAMAKKYRIYYSKDETEGDDYLVDHSIITFLMDPDGEFQEFYTKNASAVEIASRIEAKILSWKAQ